MRALAAALRSDASLLGIVAADTASTIENVEFFGPAATRLDGRVTGACRSAGTGAQELLSAAGTVERAAAEVEAAQAARLRTIERLERESLARGGS